MQLPEQPARPAYTYTVPPHVTQLCGKQSVTLVELTAQEEMMATARCQNDPIRLSFELGKQSLVAIDGKKLSTVDGSLDTEWQRMHPKLRSLIMSAYGDLHQNKPEVVSTFLQTRQIVVE